MILSIAVILALLIIGYLGFARGFFDGVISAICSIVAAVMAFSLHEMIVEYYLGGKMANSAHALVLLVLYPVIYLILRTIFDSLIPGTIRLPPTIDKVGGAITGLIAGIFAVGIVVIGAEELPFDASIAGYTRYAVEDHPSITVPGQTGRSDRSGSVWNELTKDSFDPSAAQTLLVPVDDIVIGTVRLLSNGSLAGQQPLENIHPDFLQETFGQRLGIEPGGKRVALNLPKQNLTSVTVKGVYSLPEIAQGDNEFHSFRPKFAAMYTGTLRPGPEQTLLVVRVIFSNLAADDDNLVRFSPGSVRLVTPSTTGGVTTFVDNYPIGTLQGTNLLYRNKPDDPLFVSVAQKDAGADLVFLVHTAGALSTSAGSGMRKLADGSFIEVKRLGREELAGRLVDPNLVASADVAVLRKSERAPVKPPAGATPPPAITPAPAPPATPTAPPTPGSPVKPGVIPKASTGPVFDTK